MGDRVGARVTVGRAVVSIHANELVEAEEAHRLRDVWEYSVNNAGEIGVCGGEGGEGRPRLRLSGKRICAWRDKTTQ